MATRDDALRNVFLFIRDTNTGRVTRTVIPGDLQIGLRDNPASLELGGKLAIKVTDYTVNAVNKGIINVMPEDTVVSVSIEETPESNEVQIILPANPTKGEIHFIKDVSGQASSGLPIKVLPQGNVTIDGAEEKEIIDAFGSIAVFWFRGLWRVLVSGVGLATAGTAPINSAYVTIGNDTTLTNERRVAASSNIGFTDGGANNSVSFDLTDTGVAATTYTAATVTVDAKGRITAAFSNQLGDANAEYIVASATGSLPNAKTLVAGPNITINDEGTQLSITGSAGGSGTGDGDSQARYVVTEETGSLPNAYVIEAGPNITINSGSGIISVSGTIGVPPLSATYTLPMLAGVATTATALSESKLTIGSTYFDPDLVIARLGVNTKTYTWRAIIESSELPVSAAIDLYDVNGIFGIPGGITGSILSSSAVSPTVVEFDLTSQFEGVTSAGIIEARMWKTISGSTTSSVTSKGAWLDVTAPVQNQQVDFQAINGSSTTSTALSSSKQTIGALYFDLNKVEEISGTRVFEWTTILQAKETLVSAAIDLYDVNGIVTGIPGVITGSILSSSAQTPTYLLVDLTSQLAAVTGSGVFEARLWKTLSGSVTSSVTCNNAKLTVRN